MSLTDCWLSRSIRTENSWILRKCNSVARYFFLFAVFFAVVVFNFLFNVEQNVFLSCNLMSVAMRYGRYVSRNSKSSEFINQIGVFVFFRSLQLFLLLLLSFFLFIGFIRLCMVFDSVTCLQDQTLCTFFVFERSRCEKWCCRDTSWWVAEKQMYVVGDCFWYGMCVHCSVFICEFSVCVVFYSFLKYTFRFGLVLIFHCYLLAWIIRIKMKKNHNKKMAGNLSIPIQ